MMCTVFIFFMLQKKKNYMRNNKYFLVNYRFVATYHFNQIVNVNKYKLYTWYITLHRIESNRTKTQLSIYVHVSSNESHFNPFSTFHLIYFVTVRGSIDGWNSLWMAAMWTLNNIEIVSHHDLVFFFIFYFFLVNEWKSMSHCPLYSMYVCMYVCFNLIQFISCNIFLLLFCNENYLSILIHIHNAQYWYFKKLLNYFMHHSTIVIICDTWLKSLSSNSEIWNQKKKEKKGRCSFFFSIFIIFLCLPTSVSAVYHFFLSSSIFTLTHTRISELVFSSLRCVTFTVI